MSALKEWLATYRSEATRKQYRYQLGKFFSMVYPGELHFDKTLDQLVNRYLEEREIDQVKKDITKFWTSLQDYAPKSIINIMSIIRIFLRDHELDPPHSFWNRFVRKMRGKDKPIHDDIIPTSEQLRQIFHHLPLKARALFMVQAAAGTRIGETTLIEMNDLHLNNVPPKIKLRGETTKGGTSRTVFITDEAKEMLLQWLKVRPRFLKQKPKHLSKKSPDDQRVFPYTRANAYYMWNEALKKCGLYKQDPNTKMQKMRPHTLRKRFRTQMAIEIPVDIIEVLIGHEGYMGTYRKYTDQELAEFYLKGQHVLMISTDRAELELVFQQTRETEKVIDQLNRRVKELEEEAIRSKQSALVEESRILDLIIKVQKERDEAKRSRKASS